jgi:hypothetical protein
VWYELTHGSGEERARFKAGDTLEEAKETLRLFERRVALHGVAPKDVTPMEAMEMYVDWLRVNRSEGTVRRYARVLRTFVRCFLPEFHPNVRLLRDLKPAHFEDFKRRRLAGEIDDE